MPVAEKRNAMVICCVNTTVGSFALPCSINIADTFGNADILFCVCVAKQLRQPAAAGKE